ncbi:MAG: hypothetical protein K6E79_05280 [Pseudobutyrivibrio sp.]|nr:hypothetical protein [Pseudobutyrivibrio sp.]
MKKLKFNMVLALSLLVAGLGINNMTAEAGTSKLEWTVQYNGGNSFETLGKDAQKSTLENVMPGDTLQYVVTYKNASTTTNDFYLNAEILSSLEDNSNDDTTAQGGAYSYKVSYDLNGTTTTVFDSETVGGDSTEVAGLDQAKSNGAYVNVGQLAAGQSGVVTIEIQLDGNSQDNSYMEKFAQLSVQFAVQDSAENNGEHTIINKENTVTKYTTYKIPGGTEIVYIDDDTLVPLAGGSNPQTGDSIVPLVVCGIALLVGIAFILLYFKMTRDEKEEVA